MRVGQAGLTMRVTARQCWAGNQGTGSLATGGAVSVEVQLNTFC